MRNPKHSPGSQQRPEEGWRSLAVAGGGRDDEGAGVGDRARLVVHVTHVLACVRLVRPQHLQAVPVAPRAADLYTEHVRAAERAEG